jgi:hypothetical protein
MIFFVFFFVPLCLRGCDVTSSSRSCSGLIPNPNISPGSNLKVGVASMPPVLTVRWFLQEAQLWALAIQMRTMLFEASEEVHSA